MKAALILASEGGKKFNDTLDQLKNSTGATDKAFETMSNTAEFQLRQAMTQAKNAIMQFGIAALPTITKVIEKISGMIESFSKLNPKTQEWIINGALIAAAAGPIISGIGGMIKVFSGLGKGIGKASAFLKIFSGGASAATTVASTLGSTTATTGAAIAGAGVKAGIFGGALSTLAPIAGGVVVGLGAMAGSVYLASKAWEHMANYTKVTVAPTFQSVVEGLENVSDETKSIVLDIGDQISTLEAKSIKINIDGEVTKEEANQMFTAIRGFGDTTVDHINKKMGELKEGIGGLYSELTPELQKAYNESQAATEKFYNDQKNTVNQNVEEINAIYKKASDEKRALNEQEKQRETELIQEIKDIQIEARIQDLDSYKELKKAEAELRDSHNLETAQKVVEHGQELRDKKVEFAQQEYDDEVSKIEKMKGLAEKDKADMLKIATERKDGKVKLADEEWSSVLATALSKSTELLDRYDFVNGKILSEQEATSRKQVLADAKKWAEVGNNADKGYANLNSMSTNSANITEKNLADCKMAWDSYSHDVSAEMTNITQQYNKGEISMATYQQKINSLKSNKAFADQMSNDLAQIINDFLSGKSSAAELQSAIAALQSKHIKVVTEMITEYKEIGAPPSGNRPQIGGYNQGTFSLPKRTNYNSGTFALPNMNNGLNANMGN